MSIQRLQTQLERLNAKIDKCQTQLTDLKAERNEIKTQIEEAKKAVKRGDPLPEAEPEGILETIAATVNEAVVNPLSRLMGSKSG